MKRHRSSAVIPGTLRSGAGVQTIHFGEEYVEHTSKFPRVPRQDFVDKCPLVHFNRFIVSGIPLYTDLSERGRLEDGIHVPVRPSLSSPLKNGGKAWAVMIVALKLLFVTLAGGCCGSMDA